MSNYTKTTNFGAKDTLPSGDSQKIVRGTEFDTEFNAISTAIATKLESGASSADVNFLQSGTGATTRTVQSKLRDVVSVKDFGAVGDGVTDCTTALINALAAVPAGGLVTGTPGEVYSISTRVDVNNRALSSLKIKLANNNAFLVLIGSASLQDVIIDAISCARQWGRPLFGYVNLHNANDVVIDGLVIKQGDTNSAGVFCSTKASNTTIRNCNFNEVGFSVYFLDVSYVAGVDVRLVDGVSYTGTIGSGLFISHCKIGNVANTQRGDGINVDVAANRFDTIDVSHCIGRGKVPSGALTGVGMGFANVDRLTASFNHFIGYTTSVGALHVEKSTEVLFSSNQFYNCYVGMGCGIEGENTTIAANMLSGCDQPIVLLGSVASPYRNPKIIDNQIINSTRYPVQLIDVENAVFSGNSIRNITLAGARQMIYLVQDKQASLSNVRIHNNTFIRDNGVSFTVLAEVGNVSNVFTKDNMFSGLTAGDIATFYSTVRQIGICEEYVQSASTPAPTGMVLRTNSNPTGYISGESGSLVRDVSAGVDYYSDGTNWLPVAIKRGSVTYDPPSLVDGDGVTTTVTVTGAALGDYAVASFGANLQGITLTAWVSATNTVSVRFQNETGGTIDLGSSTLRAQTTTR